MADKNNPIVLPMLLDLKKSDFALLTEKRQSILVSLLDENKNLSRISSEIKVERSNLYEILKNMEEQKIITKNENKIYGLTKKGTFLALLVAKPNGKSSEVLERKVHDFLREISSMPESELEDVIDNYRACAGQLSYKGEIE